MMLFAGVTIVAFIVVFEVTRAGLTIKRGRTTQPGLYYLTMLVSALALAGGVTLIVKSTH